MILYSHRKCNLFSNILCFLVNLKNPRPLGVVMLLRGCARKVCEVEKICGAKQKSGLKPPPLVVDSPILANFLLCPDFYIFRML